MTITELPTPRADVHVVRRARSVPLRRHRLVVGGLTLLLGLVFVARVLLGDYTITIPDFFRIVTGTEIPGASYILMESKLPRAVLGTLVGLALGVGGAIFQTTLRNPLASPDVIGVTIGASAAAVFAVVVLDQTHSGWLSLAAVVGAVAVSATVRVVSGGVAGYRLVLIGVGLAAALMAVIQYLFTRADLYDAHFALRWMTGSLHTADWPTVRVLLVLGLLLAPLLVWLARSLRVTELGEDAAAGLGVTVRRTDALLLTAVLLVAIATAAAGPVAFVAFLAGPIARALNGGRTSLPAAGLVGAVILVAADYAAKYLLGDIDFPVGVVTGACGAPFLLWLVATGRTARRSG